MSPERFLFFDVANTLVHMPDLYTSVCNNLTKMGYRVTEQTARTTHKTLQIAKVFPDRPDQTFYAEFNVLSSVEAKRHHDDERSG